MDDRKKAIQTLEIIMKRYTTLDKDELCALQFAIDSMKVDRAYDLAYEKVDFIEIPGGATNRDVIRAAFDETMAYNIEYYTKEYMLQDEWLNSPYRKEN